MPNYYEARKKTVKQVFIHSSLFPVVISSLER